MARNAQSIDFILSQVRTLAGPVVGGQAYFYASTELATIKAKCEANHPS